MGGVSVGSLPDATIREATCRTQAAETYTETLINCRCTYVYTHTVLTLLVAGVTSTQSVFLRSGSPKLTYTVLSSPPVPGVALAHTTYTQGHT